VAPALSEPKKMELELFLEKSVERLKTKPWLGKTAEIDN
jgi:hypothetical protein